MNSKNITKTSSAIMIQGTTSDAGKSALVTGICRVLTRRGISAAPFKPQNMALNSAVTSDGGEIGRSQAVQARACCIEPHSDMNPILLKPSTDKKAQVIVQGKALINFDASEFHDYKKQAMPWVLESFHRLSKQYQAVVVEGAGSPAEINLRDNDIANMGFAEAVDCPVIIVADIDKGGVFAHLVGTLALLSQSEQARVKGFVINRFRGDIELLKPGLDWLEEKTGKPVLGVVPYLHGFHLEAEDALNSAQQGEGERFKIRVPVLPRISNHTDFDALRLEPDVDFQYVPEGQPLTGADLIILPGTKSVRNDLTYLKRQRWDEDIQRHLRYGGKLLGICGGFQMLGKTINDPQGIESSPGVSDGLSYFDMNTQLNEEKQLHRVRAKVSEFLSNEEAFVEGYEIHVGESTGNALLKPMWQVREKSSGGREGAVSEDNQIAGTYLHGLFDSDDARSCLLNWAGLKRKMSRINYQEKIEAEIDRLADALEQSLNWQRLHEIIGADVL